MATSVYQQGGYGTAALFPNPIIARRNPSTTDTVSPSGQPYQILQGWNNELTDACFIYLGSGNWVTLTSVVGSVNQLSGNTGIAIPAAGNINIVGSGSLSFTGAGSTITGTITAGTGLISTITGNSGGPLSPTAGNMNILGNNALGITATGAGSTLTIAGIQGTTTQVGVYEAATATETQTGTDSTRVVTPLSLQPSLITPFVVGPGGAYTTIQSAITAAAAAGGGVVYIKPGAYTENLTLADNVDLYGTPAVSQNQGQSVSITGTHTPPATGHCGFNSICFISTTDVFSSAAAGTTHLAFLNCESAVQNGHFLNLANWTGILEIYDNNPNTAGAPFAVNDGGINNTGGSTILIFSAGVGSGSNVMNLSGTVVTEAASFGCPVNFQTGSNINLQGHEFLAPVTFSNNTTGACYFCDFVGGASAAITMSSSAAIQVLNSVISSSNNPAIAGAGAGVLTLGGNTYTSNALHAGTLTVAYTSTEGILVTKNTPGASPQIVNARTGQVAFTDVIANGAYGTLTLTNSTIAAASVIVAVASCTTVNSALQIVEVTPGAGSVAFRIFNAGSASTAADIFVNFWVIG